MPTARPGRRHLPIDVFDLAALVALAGLSVWVLVLLVSKSAPDHIWTGTDGPFIGDQMQYLGWINEAAYHLLVGNPFRSIAGDGLYFHPGLAVSGGLVRLGMTPSVAYLIWKPVAVITLFVATRSYVRQLLTQAMHRRAALVLALFYVSPASLLAQHFHWFSLSDRVALQAMGTEMWPGLYLWGYPFTALAVAAMPLTLLAYCRDRQSGRIGPWAPTLGLLCAWLQPWQGATLLLLLAASEGLLWKRERTHRPALLAITVGAIAAPLVYYSVLSRFDTAWAQSGRVNLITFSWLPLVVALAPLGVFALLAYRLPAVSFHDITVRVWPIAALAVYGLISVFHVGTYPLHALQGLSIPLAILAVAGTSHLRLPANAMVRLWAGILAVGLLIVPSVAHELDNSRTIGKAVFGVRVPVFITASEQAALSYLKRNPMAGPVLASIYLGQTIPAETGRHTWLGIFSWTPDYVRRTALADDLFAGRLDRSAALSLVRSSGVRFLLSDCGQRTSLSVPLTTIVTSVRQFGCATVYTVSTGR